MSTEALRRDILAAHVEDPSNADKYDGKMVWLLYDDAELVLTKGGVLFGCRSHHIITPGQPRKLAGLDLPLHTETDFTYAILTSGDLATSLQIRVSSLIRASL